jgi:hypothetical protein
MVCHVTWKRVTDVSEKYNDFIFKVKMCAFLDCLTLKMETPHSSKD